MRRRRVREHNERAWHAWHVAALPQQKHPVPLKSLMLDERRKQVMVSDPQEMLALVKTMNAAMGGTVVKVKNIPMH